MQIGKQQQQQQKTTADHAGAPEAASRAWCLTDVRSCRRLVASGKELAPSPQSLTR